MGQFKVNKTVSSIVEYTVITSSQFDLIGYNSIIWNIDGDFPELIKKKQGDNNECN